MTHTDNNSSDSESRIKNLESKVEALESKIDTILEIAFLTKEMPCPVFKGEERLTFEKVLNDPNIDVETKDKIRNDESCAMLRELLNSEIQGDCP